MTPTASLRHRSPLEGENCAVTRPRDRLLERIRVESEALDAVVRSLAPVDFARTVHGEGEGRWTVKECLAHVAAAKRLVEVIASRQVRGIEADDRSPPEVLGFVPDEFNQRHLPTWQRMSAAEVCVELDAAHRGALIALERLDDDLIIVRDEKTVTLWLEPIRAVSWLWPLLNHAKQHRSAIELAVGR